MKGYKRSPVFSIALSLLLSTALFLSTFEDGFALKSKGTLLPETGSKKVCGDRLCSDTNIEYNEKKMKHDENVDKKKYKTEQEQLEMQYLQTFDDLDFDVFTNQKWDRLHESHSKDIIVHWPDGRITEGIESHIEDLKMIFVYAPDTRIEQHPIKIASGKWTSVVGVIEGTFTEPMPLPDGTMIEPTGMSFKLKMVTVGHWNENGVMDEEYLFWDNLAFMTQMGLR